MTFNQNLETFAGKPVVDFTQGEPLDDPANTIPRLRVNYDSGQDADELLRDLVASGVGDQLTGLIIGQWSPEMYENTSAKVIEMLVAAAEQLPNLRALFLGEMICEENEVSWIYQCDVSALWQAFPRLEVFCVRGSNGLSLGKLRLNHLRQLSVETGGLPKSVLAEIAASQLPSLEHLELYLGTEDYGWDGTIQDVEPLLSGKLFPKLKYLGLRDSDIADEVAKAIVKSPLLERIEVLDLSLGTLGDEGAEALLACPAVKKLKGLDLHHHYMSDAAAQKFASLGPQVDVSDEQSESEYGRYVSIGE
jgi:hypothetical protein